MFSWLLALFALDPRPVEPPQVVRPSPDGLVSVIVYDSEHFWNETGYERLYGARVTIYPDASSSRHGKERPLASAVSGRTGWADVLVDGLPPGSYMWRVDGPWVDGPPWAAVQGRVVIGVPLETTWECLDDWPVGGPLHVARLKSCLRRVDRQDGTGFMVKMRRADLDDGAAQVTTLTSEDLHRIPF